MTIADDIIEIQYGLIQYVNILGREFILPSVVKNEALLIIVEITKSGSTSGHNPKALVAGMIRGLLKEHGYEYNSRKIADTLGITEVSLNKAHKFLVLKYRKKLSEIANKDPLA